MNSKRFHFTDPDPSGAVILTYKALRKNLTIYRRDANGEWTRLFPTDPNFSYSPELEDRQYETIYQDYLKKKEDKAALLKRKKMLDRRWQEASNKLVQYRLFFKQSFIWSLFFGFFGISGITYGYFVKTEMGVLYFLYMTLLLAFVCFIRDAGKYRRAKKRYEKIAKERSQFLAGRFVLLPKQGEN